MNNIPIPSRKEYIRKMIRKTELFISRLRWKYFWAIKNKSKDKRFDNHPQAKIEIEGKNMHRPDLRSLNLLRMPCGI